MILKIASFWFLAWLLTWPAMLAYHQQRYPSLACERYRSDLGFATGWSFFPPAWLIAPFATGFYEYGFQVFPLPACRERR